MKHIRLEVKVKEEKRLRFALQDAVDAIAQRERMQDEKTWLGTYEMRGEIDGGEYRVQIRTASK